MRKVIFAKGIVNRYEMKDKQHLSIYSNKKYTKFHPIKIVQTAVMMKEAKLLIKLEYPFALKAIVLKLRLSLVIIIEIIDKDLKCKKWLS